MNVYSLIKPLGAFFVVMGALIMVGWVTNIQLLKVLVPGTGVASFPTAFSIFLSGLILRSFYRLCVGEKQGDSMVRIMASAVLLLLIFFPIFVGYFWNIDVGLDTFFEPVTVNGVEKQSFIPSVGSLLSIGAMLLMTFAVSTGHSITKVSRWGGIVLLTVGGLALVGYALQDESLYFVTPTNTGMAFRAAFSFALSGAAFIALGVRPHTEHQPAEGERAHAPQK